MTELYELQANIWKAITGLSPVQLVSEIDNSIVNNIDLNRLSIYQSTVQSAHLLACEASYPLVAKILGAKLFNGLAKGYFITNIPKNPDLNVYGDTFPEFLNEAANNVEPLKEIFNKVEIYQLAKLEWAMEQGYFADDSKFSEKDLEIIQTVPIDNIRFELHDSVALFQFENEISQLFRLKELDNITKEKIVDYQKQSGQKENILVYREGWNMKYEVIDSIAVEHINMINNKKSYKELHEMETFNENLIQKFLQQGIISGVNTF